MIRPVFALLLAIYSFEAAADKLLFVSPKGSDEGQCESNNPCATIGRACSVANSSPDRITGISIAVGLYQNNTFCDVWYHHTVNVSGDCNDRPDIVLSGNDVAFRAQDSAILVVQCVNIRSVGSGSIAFASRQFAIMDVGNIRIGQLAGGTVISAQVVLYGSVGYVAQAVQMSTVILHPTCTFNFENTPHVNAMVRAELKSLIISGAPWVGDFTGEKYICVDSTIYGATTIPGTDSASVTNCLAR